MLVVISPAKTLDFETPVTFASATRPGMLSASNALVEELRQYSGEDLQKLMGISPALAELNSERYQNWRSRATRKHTKQAIFAFQGDVYTGLNAAEFDADDLEFAQQHLRILSGLYGVLRPLDLIQPYRLEMGTALGTAKGKNLYQFWGDELAKAVNKELKRLKTNTLVNLASNEYFKAIDVAELNARVVTPTFKDFKNGQYKFLSFFAKKARGMMSAYIIKHRVSDPEALKQARIGGYRFNAKESTEDKWVFRRKLAQ